MVQGISQFEARKGSEKVTSDRGFVEFGLDCDPSQSIKFVGFFYSEREFGARANFRSNMPWMMSVHPDGKVTMTLALATKFFHQGERWYLLLSAERVSQICPSQEVFMSFMGGFDPVAVALDHKVPTSFLMFIYPIDAKQIGLANIDL
jgi:hypothetical protein